VRRRAVIKHIGRRSFFQLQIDFDTVALTGAYASTRLVESESLLVVLGDNFFQLSTCNGKVVPRAGTEQIINGYPAAGLQFQSDSLWRVPQVLAQIFTDFYDAFFIHTD
jgi:hypothetical protein